MWKVVAMRFFSCVHHLVKCRGKKYWQHSIKFHRGNVLKQKQSIWWLLFMQQQCGLYFFYVVGINFISSLSININFCTSNCLYPSWRNYNDCFCLFHFSCFHFSKLSRNYNSKLSGFIDAKFVLWMLTNIMTKSYHCFLKCNSNSRCNFL